MGDRLEADAFKENFLRTDRDWATIDGQLCRILDFRPFAGATVANGKAVSVDKSLPYAMVELEGVRLPKGTVGCIFHKVDFQHLWAAFQERGIAADEEVLIIWTKRQFKLFANIFSAFLPRTWVMVWKKGAYEWETDPKLRHERRTVSELMPITDWKPDVMN
jgi:hypothetical protein